MRRWTLTLASLAAATMAALAVATPAGAASPDDAGGPEPTAAILAGGAGTGENRLFPDRIALPDGFFPEGIAIDGLDAYVGSLVDGAIVRQDLVRGRTEPLAPSPGPGAIAVGMDVDRHDRLWVAGGGPALDPSVVPALRVYDTRTGDLLVELEVPAGFVNDVVVTRDAAWFTDSFGPQLIRVPIARDGSIGEPEIVTLGGDWTEVPGEFGANGIVAARGGRTLIVAQTVAPEDPADAALYRVPADSDADAVEAERVLVDGPALPSGEPVILDGLVLAGRTLYAVAGEAGVIEFRLSRDLREGRVVDVLDVPGSVTPTTADRLGPRLYVVDAKFPLFGDPDVAFDTVAIRR